MRRSPKGAGARPRALADDAYITVGTGVGVGLVVNGRLVHGLGHPQFFRLRIARQAGDDWRGACAFHGDCVEGLASGVAIAARAGMPAKQIPADSSVWEGVAHALSQLLHALVLTTAPRRILIGGGVLEARPELLETMRQRVVASRRLSGPRVHNRRCRSLYRVAWPRRTGGTVVFSPRARCGRHLTTERYLSGTNLARAGDHNQRVTRRLCRSSPRPARRLHIFVEQLIGSWSTV